MTATELTHFQHGIWFTEQAGQAGTAYHLAVTLEFSTEVDEAALLDACRAVSRRRPALGGAVDDSGGTPVLIPAARRVPVTALDLPDSELPERLAAEVARPFDLRTGPLARFCLLRNGNRRILLLVAHHLVFDGASKDVLLRDLAGAYNGADPGAGTEAEPEPPATVEPQAIDVTAARQYWSTRWPAAGRAVLPGLTRVPAGAEPGAAVRLEFDRDLVAGLGRTADAIGVTRYELLLAAVQTLLARSGDESGAVTLILSTRTPATAGQVGLHVNELPFLAPRPSGPFDRYALAVRTALREVYPFRAVPLSRATGGVRPAPALTPVTIGYRRRDAAPIRFGPLRPRVDWVVPNGSARNALELQFVDSGDELTAALLHSPAAIGTDAVRRIAAQLRTLLESVVTDPARPVGELELLPPDERALVLGDPRSTARDWPALIVGPGLDRAVTLPALLAEQVRRTPDATAATDGARCLSYAELDRGTRRLTAVLREQGVGPGALVAVALGRSLESLVAQLAVLRAGAAYVPVDPAHPVARQALVLADARPALVVTGSGTASRLKELPKDVLKDLPEDVLKELAGLPVLVLDDLARLEERADRAEDVRPAPGSVAYVMYTSGSTGRPKGVAVPHGALANLLLGLAELLGSSAADRWLNLTTPSFDISGLELYLPLVTGGRVVIAADAGALDGPALVRLIREQAVTHVQATPSGWRVLLEAGFGADGPEPVVGLTGGEALPLPLARQLRGRVSRLLNVYGPTETTIWSTADEVPEDPGQVTIGRPIANTRAYVLDERLRPVPIDVPGQLYLGGDGLADGYRNRPGLSADRFVPDPFGPAGARLYRTGDLCRWLPDGRIGYLGRTDDQVKIRGHRVELGEIEARLLAHPGVAQAAVALRGNDSGEPRLVGYLVPAGRPPTPAELREYLGRLLPTALVPSAWQLLDRLPLTPNGKLDRAALPDVSPEPAPQSTPRSTVAPTGVAAPEGSDDPVLEQVRAIWQQVLEIERVGAHEDLFDLGGHSLTITRISSRITQQFGVEVPLDAFFDTPTIAEIADVVRQGGL